MVAEGSDDVVMDGVQFTAARLAVALCTAPEQPSDLDEHVVPLGPAMASVGRHLKSAETAPRQLRVVGTDRVATCRTLTVHLSHPQRLLLRLACERLLGMLDRLGFDDETADKAHTSVTGLIDRLCTPAAPAQVLVLRGA